MAGPRLLLIETSGRVGLVALAEGEALRGQRRLDEARRHARDLAPAIAALLQEQNWRAAELGAVIASRGPGSYTGLRVGLMTAKTLAWATGCALIAIDTFAAIARQAPAECARLDVLADAQQDRVYVQSFVRSAEGWQAASALAIERCTDWLARRDPSGWVSGPGVAKWQGQLGGVSLVAAERRDPGAEALLALGLERLSAGQRDDPYAVEPLYLRASSAEEQLRRP